eukprot:TRINITY_DN66848_c0_g1_i1.p1 TRINITY_DN66848_c0_g1~~TRINITY_DN66848_c0_g1_i1.p1  ORF type:complete len:282 (-),score=44.75 TRINITY_DN66848_c0_g1_i1:169-1014(-)
MKPGSFVRDVSTAESSEKLPSTVRANFLCSCCCDAADLAGASIWLVGCVFFLPTLAKDSAIYLWGCVLFIIGEWIYIALGVHSLRQAVSSTGYCSAPMAEAVGTILGGAMFFVGTVLFLPKDMAALDLFAWTVSAMKEGTDGWGSELLNLPGNDKETAKEAGHLFAGTVFFVLGSLGFSFSSFANALGMESLKTQADQLSVASTTLHMGGGLLFCLGSMGFIAQVGCDSRMVAIGAWCFILGCILFMLGAVLALLRNLHVFRTASRLETSDSDSCSLSGED